jgi:hypothetical protein
MMYACSGQCELSGGKGLIDPRSREGGANAPEVSFNSYNGHNMKWYARREVGLLCTEGAPQVALLAYLDPGYGKKKLSQQARNEHEKLSS